MWAAIGYLVGMLVIAKVFYDVGKEQGHNEGYWIGRNAERYNYRCLNCLHHSADGCGHNCALGKFQHASIDALRGKFCSDITVKPLDFSEGETNNNYSN